MISNIVIALLVAQNVAGAAINKRQGESIIGTTPCMDNAVTAVSSLSSFPLLSPSDGSFIDNISATSAIPSSSIFSYISSNPSIVPSSTVVSSVPASSSYSPAYVPIITEQSVARPGLFVTSVSGLAVASSSISECVQIATETVYVTVLKSPPEVPSTVHTTIMVLTTVLAPPSATPLSQTSPSIPEPPGSLVGQTTSTVVFSLPPGSGVVPGPSYSLTPLPQSGSYAVSVASSVPGFSPVSSQVSSTVVASPSSPVATSLPGFSYPVLSPAPSPIQPTPSFHTGAPSSHCGTSNSTLANPTGIAPSASFTLVPTDSSFVIPISSGTAPCSSAPVVPVPGGYAMATNGTLVTVSLSTTVFSTSSAQPTSSEGYQTETSTLTLAVAVSPTSVLSDIATTTVDAGSDVYAAMFVAEAGRMNNKRAETTVNIALDQTAVSSKPEPPSAPRASSKPPSAPKSSKPKSSSKPSAGDEVKTITISQDPRCPYPYPGIHCGMPVTTVTTVRKATKTSEASEPKKTGSVEYCPYLYPGGKGDACL